MKYEIIKGSEKDFECAPESATVRIIENGFEDRFPIFADKFENCSTRTHCATGDYDSHIADVSNWTVIAERRPITEPVWNGFSSVRVGEACEVRPYSDATEWQAGIVNYLSDHTIVIGLSSMTNGKAELVAHPATLKFRPIRSSEDVARDEAKGVIAELCRSSASNGHSADLIYDAIAAGKIPGIALSGK